MKRLWKHKADDWPILCIISRGPNWPLLNTLVPSSQQSFTYRHSRKYCTTLILFYHFIKKQTNKQTSKICAAITKSIYKY